LTIKVGKPSCTSFTCKSKREKACRTTADMLGRQTEDIRWNHLGL